MIEAVASFPLTVPILTALFALGGSWLGAFLGKATEHQQWLRNQKQEAYGDYLAGLPPVQLTPDL